MDAEKEKGLAPPLSKRTMSETAIYAPMRRRSLMQHGVATRPPSLVDSSSRSNSLQIQSSFHMRSFSDETTRSSSPLPTLTPLSTDLQIPHVSEVRTSTPNDLSHIGSFKLGSLRITNGAASPDDDRRAGINGRIASIASDKASSNSRSALTQRSHTISAASGSARPPWAPQAQAVVRHELEASSSLTITIPDPMLAEFNFNDAVLKKAQELATQYQQDIQLSPFSFQDSPSASPTFHATSKQMAVDDNLFELDCGTPILESTSRDSGSFDSGYPITPVSQIKASKPLSKADSGYSSTASLRSLRKDVVSFKEGPSIPTKDLVRVPSSNYSTYTATPISRTSSLSAELQMASRSSQKPPAVPAKVPLDHISNSLAFAIPRSPRSSTSTQPSPRSTNSKDHYRQQSLPEIPTGKLMSAPSTQGTENPSKWRLGPKDRPQSYHSNSPLFTVQALRSPNEQLRIPPIPADALRRLEQRVDAFPTNSFPNTVHQFRRTPSKETLGTIFSVGSLETREELTHARLQSSLPAIPTSIPEDSSPVQSKTDHGKSTFALIPARVPSKVEKKSFIQPFNEPLHDFESELTSIDNISTSLGASPYDVALSAGGIPAPRMHSNSSQGPENVHFRAKSMTSSLEAAAAARFQRTSSVSRGRSPGPPQPQQPQQRPPFLQNQLTSYSHPNHGMQFPLSSFRSASHNSHNSHPSSTFTIRDLPSQRSSAEQESRRFSMLARVERVKSPPPTPRRLSLATSISPAHSPLPLGSESAPPERIPPPPPAFLTSPIPTNGVEKRDPWMAQREFWRVNSASASTATSQPAQSQARILERQSLELNSWAPPRKPSSTPPRRPASCKPTFGEQRPQVRNRRSFENAHSQAPLRNPSLDAPPPLPKPQTQYHYPSSQSRPVSSRTTRTYSLASSSPPRPSISNSSQNQPQPRTHSFTSTSGMSNNLNYSHLPTYTNASEGYDHTFHMNFSGGQGNSRYPSMNSNPSPIHEYTPPGGAMGDGQNGYGMERDSELEAERKLFSRSWSTEGMLRPF